MSLHNGALRRLSLLAGSSLIAASLSAGAFTAITVTPTLAHAANECDPAGVDPSANGAASDSYVCPSGTYSSGITYSSDGDLMVTAPDFIDVHVDGVNLTGNGADNVTWESSALYPGFGVTATTGPVLGITSETGDISITSGLVSGGDLGSHAILAESTGGGDVSITSGDAYAYFGSAGVVTIQGTSNGGDVSIATTGTTWGRLRGILAETSGPGDVMLSISGDTFAVGYTASGEPVVETVAGDGQTNIIITAGSIGVRPGGIGIYELDGLALRASSTSASATAVNVQNSGGWIVGAVDFSSVTAGGVVFSNTGAGYWSAGGESVFGAGADTLIFASNSQAIGQSQGAPPQSKLLGGASIDFGAGDDLMVVQTEFNVGNLGPQGGSIDFGAGNDTLNNLGLLSTDGPVTFSNLENFNNSGSLFLGARGALENSFILYDQSDTGTEDVLVLPGVTFTGSELSRLIAAVHFTDSQQAGCATPTGAGDCLYLPGGATTGSTLVTLLNAGDPATQGGFNTAGVTVIDVAGGTSAASHFTLDPNSQGYIVDPIYGPAITRPGLFVYSLRYDAANQRHVVVGLPRTEALEYVVLGSAAQSIWYMTSAAVTDRQTDLRKGTEGSVWMKASGEYSKRDIANTIGAYDGSYAIDNSYKLYAGTLMAGMDFITGHSGGYDYVLGAQIGYVGSTFDLDASPSSGQMTGATGGVYGSLWDGAFFLDGTFNTNFLTLDYDAPGLGSKTTTWLRSVGAQLEGGRRFMLTEKIFAEPLATAAFMYTTFEEISLDGGEVTPDDAQSQRAALGLRLGADMFGGPIKVRYFVTGRAWNEFSGENEVVVFNPGDDLRLGEDSSGSFGEAQAGLSLFNDAQTIAGFLTSGVKFKDGYNAVDLDLGLRLRW